VSVEQIYQWGGSLFLGSLLLNVVTTGARVIWYLRHHEPMPRLLPRDIWSKGGLLLSFAPIVLLRFYPIDVRVAFTTGNVPWALLTIVPATAGMLVYAYFEMFVIKRDGTS
jgi:hypothetical protein